MIYLVLACQFELHGLVDDGMNIHWWVVLQQFDVLGEVPLQKLLSNVE